MPGPSNSFYPHTLWFILDEFSYLKTQVDTKWLSVAQKTPNAVTTCVSYDFFYPWLVSVPHSITLPGSFAGLGFLSLYLSGKIKAFDSQGHVAKLCIVILPLLLASLVGISRVDDYRHHWEDVFVGGLIGLYLISPFLFQMYESFDAIGNQSDLIYDRIYYGSDVLLAFLSSSVSWSRLFNLSH